MHTDLSKHLHTEKCNQLIELLGKCRQDNPFGKLFGYCNTEDHRVVNCLKEERVERRRKNYEKSIETHARLQQRWQESKQ